MVQKKQFLEFLKYEPFLPGIFLSLAQFIVYVKSRLLKDLLSGYRDEIWLSYSHKIAACDYIIKREGGHALPHYYAKYAINLNKSGLLVRPLVRLCLVVLPVLESRAFWNKYTSMCPQRSLLVTCGKRKQAKLWRSWNLKSSDYTCKTLPQHFLSSNKHSPRENRGDSNDQSC